MDKLIVLGVLPLDGEYEFDIAGMLTMGHPEQLTNREGRRIKLMSGVRAGELSDAFESGDNDVLIAIAAIVLARAGKRFDEERLWDAPMGSGLEFVIEERVEEEADADVPPKLEPPPEPVTDLHSPSGGRSSRTTLDPPENGQSRTGHQPSGTPSVDQDFDLGTLVR